MVYPEVSKPGKISVKNEKPGSLGSCSAQLTDDGVSGHPAWPGVAAGPLLPLPHPHHPARGPAGGAAS